MPPFRLVIPRPFYDELVAHAVRSRPLECCGLLAGVVEGGVGRVTACYPFVNELASPTEFRSEPRGMFAAVKAMRAAGTDVLAAYHSHPTSPPVPSRLDRERSYDERVVCLIVGLLSDPPEVRGWWLTATSAAAAELALDGR